MAKTANGLPGIYNATPLTLTDGDGVALAVDANGYVITTLATGDIEIGAVELKDGATDNRGVINAANTARAATDKVLLVQTIDATGRVGSGGFAEDTAHVTGDIGTEVLTKRTDTAASSADTTGDYATLNTDSLGKLWSRPDGGAANGAADNGNPVKTGGVFNTTPPVLDSGDRGDTQMDVSGNTKSTLGTLLAGEDLTNNLLAIQQRPIAASTYSKLRFQNLGANITLNVKATPGNVFAIQCHNTTAGTLYFLLHNTATTSSGAPLYGVQVPPTSTVIVGEDFFGSAGMHFSTGIAFGMSTSETTYTAAAAATDHVSTIMYI